MITFSRTAAVGTAVALTALAGTADAIAAPASAPSAVVASSAAAGATTPASRAARGRDATYATALNGIIPCPFSKDYPEIGCGRMRNGEVKPRKGASPGAHVNIKNIDGNWKKTSVRFVDVAGDRHKEAVVLISSSAGGVAWPNDVLVYDGYGRLLNRWNSAEATRSEPREMTAFLTTRRTSLDVIVRGVQRPGEAIIHGTARYTFRLSKGTTGRPVWKLITKR